MCVHTWCVSGEMVQIQSNLLFRVLKIVLTDTQKQFLLRAKQGEFLLNITNKKRVRVWIRATELERNLMGEE